MNVHDDARISFTKIIQKFLESPTNVNRDKLISGAESYRDAWILTMASGNRQDNIPDPKKWAPEAIAAFYSEQLSKTSTQTKYAKKLEAVRRLPNGIPVKLALQQRTIANQTTAYWTVSWRTKYSPSGTNRRFYYSSGGYWQFPASIALELINDLEEQGGLEEAYQDKRKGSEKIKLLISPEIKKKETSSYNVLCNSVMGNNEDWGSSPHIVALTDTEKDWRKVMIVNNENMNCTFRSLTKNSSYMPKKELGNKNEWWLDNAMMDANVQQMKMFRDHLREIIKDNAY